MNPIIVVDYNAGNLTSVMNALSRIGVDAKSSRDADEIAAHDMPVYCKGTGCKPYSEELQLAAVNLGQDVSGLQIGLFNRAERVNGLQIGIANYAYQMQGVQIGLFNVIADSNVPFMIGLNAAF